MNKYLDEIIVFGTLAFLLLWNLDCPTTPPFPIAGERTDSPVMVADGLVAWDNKSEVWCDMEKVNKDLAPTGMKIENCTFSAAPSSVAGNWTTTVVTKE